MEENKSEMFHEEIRKNDHENLKTVYKVQCFPLYSILLAVEKTEIDFFGLDVEGSEFKILRTIPWHKVDIKVNRILQLKTILFQQTHPFFRGCQP